MYTQNDIHDKTEDNYSSLIKAISCKVTNHADCHYQIAEIVLVNPSVS